MPSRRRLSRPRSRSENEPTFATVAYNEPRDWGYTGLLAFTAVLMTRPQDTLTFLNPFHLAELCAIIGIAPMVLHRLSSRQPVFRVTPETTALIAFGAVILLTVPFSIWPGGALGLFTDSYMKLLVDLRPDDEHADDAEADRADHLADRHLPAATSRRGRLPTTPAG